jgi:hypothetical protein
LCDGRSEKLIDRLRRFHADRLHDPNRRQTVHRFAFGISESGDLDLPTNSSRPGRETRRCRVSSLKDSLVSLALNADG